MSDPYQFQQAERERWHNKPRHRPWRFLLIVLVLAICAAVLFPVVTKQKGGRGHDMTRSMSNAKQVYYLLIEFDQEYGCFPSNTTADEHFGGHGKGSYSNDYLRQLALAGLTKSEEIFYARGGVQPNKTPDGRVGSKNNNYSQFLQTGECGFAYISGIAPGDDPATPVLLTPMYGDGEKFNPDVYADKAVVLQVDGSVRLKQVDEHHRALDPGVGSHSIFAGGSASVWGAKGFDFSRLHYADAPYTYKPKSKIMKWKWPLMGGLLAVLIFGNFLRLWVLARREKRQLLEDRLFPKSE